jgi:hypothetical protein
MKLLVQGWLLALVLIVELVGLVALAKHYYTQTTIETPPPTTQKNIAIVASDDGEGYQWVEWDASCGVVVWGVQRESESSVVEANIFSEAEAQECRVHIRPHLATTTRQPGVVRPTGGHRPEPTTSENSPSTPLGE